MKKIIFVIISAMCFIASGFALDKNYGLNVVSTPVNPNATKETKALMSYLASNYGKKTLSGQMDLTWAPQIDMLSRVYNDTGKYPAIMGYDFLGSNYGAEQVKEAIEWAKKGGIVTFCWHWKVKGPNGKSNFSTAAANKEEGTDFVIPYDYKTDTIDTETKTSARGPYDWAKLVKDMDKVADRLKTLQDAGIPVLWRPFHEASGGWFWWGASGKTKVERAAAYKALYIFMFDYYTNVKGLNNLIWVWNGQDADWYPGDDYVDIIGTDIYDKPQDYSSKIAQWLKCVNYSDDPEEAPKMVALTETGDIPSPEKMQSDGAYWSYFMVWNDAGAEDFKVNLTHKDNFWTGEFHNTNAHKKEVYDSDFVITLDELNISK